MTEKSRATTRPPSVTLFTALIPVVLFWLVQKYYGLVAALYAGCAAAVAELTWEKIRHGRVSTMTKFANGLVLGLGAVSYFMHSGVFYKLQPGVVELTMAGLMLWPRMRGTESFMIKLFRDSPMVDPVAREQALANPVFHERIKMMDSRVVILLIFHGLAMLWAAIWASTGTWALMKGVLFYVLLIIVLASTMRKAKKVRS